MSKLWKFDDAMAKMNRIRHKPQHSRTGRYFGMGLVVSSILLLSVHVDLLTFLEASVCVNSLVYFFVTEFYLLISFQFIVGTLCIHRRFSVLNMNVR